MKTEVVILEQRDVVVRNVSSDVKRLNAVVSIRNIWIDILNEYSLSEKECPLILVEENFYHKALVDRRKMLNLPEPENTKDDEMKIKSTEELFSTHVYFKHDENEDTVNMTVLGVYGLIDRIYKYIEFDNHEERNIKFRCIEIMLRHEMGHILSWKHCYDNKTIGQFNEVHKVISERFQKDMEKWDFTATGEDMLRQYYNLPEESLANHFVGLSANEIIDAAMLFVEVI